LPVNSAVNTIGGVKMVLINGNIKYRMPNFLNVSILDIEGEAALLYLDKEGIMVSTGSACNSESLEPSYILSAFGRTYEHIHGSLRFTLGKNTKIDEIKYLMKVLPEVVKKLRRISPLNQKVKNKTKTALPKAFIGQKLPHFISHK